MTSGPDEREHRARTARRTPSHPERRIRLNEQLFRRANDEVAVAAGRVRPLRVVPFFCECTAPVCGELADVPLAEYVSHSLFSHRFFLEPRCALLALDGADARLLQWGARYAVVDRDSSEPMSEHTTPGDREQRLRENEAVFRALNEQVELLREHGSRQLLVCECSDEECRDRLDLSLDEYVDVRSRPDCYVLEPGHERGEVEDVVARNDRYTVVHKRPAGAAQA